MSDKTVAVSDVFNPDVVLVVTKEGSSDCQWLDENCEYLGTFGGYRHYKNSPAKSEIPDRWKIFSTWKESILKNKDG